MNQSEPRPFVAWPGWPHLRVAWFFTLLITICFCLVFAGADWFTAQRTNWLRVHLDAELLIPLIPFFTVIYMSIYFLFLAAPFILRTRREITTLAFSQATTILFAGICFLLIPAKLAYAPATDSELGVWKDLFRFADKINLNYNLLPSLHVALSIVCIELFAAHANFTGKLFLRGWGILIAVATVFTHQHHLLDAITGYLLALVILKLRTHRKFFSSH